MAKAPMRIWFNIGYGQSNESGHGSRYGDASTSTNPIPNGYIANLQGNFTPPSGPPAEGMFDVLASLIARRNGHNVYVRNHARDGTSQMSDWTGFTGSAGTTDVPCVVGDAGYDPNTYIAGMLADIVFAKAKGYTVICCVQGHQADGAYRASSVATADINMLNRQITAGADYVMYSTVQRDLGAPTGWDAGGFFPLVRAAVFTGMAGNAKFIQGADLTDVPTSDMRGASDGVHVGGAGIRTCGMKHYDVVNATGFI